MAPCKASSAALPFQRSRRWSWRCRTIRARKSRARANKHAVSLLLHESRIRLRQVCAHLLTPRVQLLQKRRSFIGHLHGEITRLGLVVAQIVEFDVVVLEIFEQFPVARTNRANRRRGAVV